MEYSTSELSSITNGEIIYSEDHHSISRIYIDSRKVWNGSGSCFIALVGVNFNAHDHIAECYEKGIRVFIVSEKRTEWKTLTNASFIHVTDPVRAMQQIAKDHRSRFSYPLVAITGSNGKTTVKEWLSQSLEKKFKVVKSPKSYNSQVGVPLSVFQMDHNHNMGIFEAGISHVNEMEALESILKPDIGIFTNIGNAHGEYFEDDLQKAHEKALLFLDVKDLIYCADNDVVSKVLEENSANKITWSEKGNGMFNFNNVDKEGVVIGVFQNEKRIFSLPFSDAVSKQNLFHIITLLWNLGVSESEINTQLKELQHVQMRLETIEGMSNSIFINDVYNSDLTSLEAALEIFKTENTKPKKHLILSDIKNTGYSNESISNILKGQVQGIGLSSVHLIGKNAKEYRNAFKETQIHTYASTEELLEKRSSFDFKNSTVLIKGSRSFKLERFAEQFQKKNHKTVLEINLSSVLENLNYYRSKLKPSVKIAVMVKAFAYGSGLHEIAALLEKNNVDQLAVAYVDEGIALRERNISLPIMIMNPEDAPMEILVDNRLEPVVYSWETFKHFSRAHEELPIHIKFDTGMNRLGFDVSDIEKLIEKIKDEDMVVASVFTHLSSSEDPAEDGFTKTQFQNFELIRGAFSCFENVTFHALNSAGIGRFPDQQMDMVRLGIGLYGFTSAKKDQAFLQPALTLKSTIAQIKTVSKGDSVGYSRAFKAKEEMKIGVVPIGYADGVHRAFGNGKGSVWINGKPATVIGNICMDMCMIDLNEVDCKVGDEVEFFGSNKSITITAKEMNTIAYEVLANISQRVKRVFYFD